MSKSIIRKITLLSALGLAAATANAQQQPDQPQSAQQPQQQQPQSTQQNQTTQQSRGTQAQGQPGQTGESLDEMARNQPEQLEGMEIQNAQGEEVGEIEQIVRRISDGEIYAVVTSGGFAGIGEDRSAVPLSELQHDGDRIVYRVADPTQQLEQQRFEESEFEPVAQQRQDQGDPQASQGRQQQRSEQQASRDQQQVDLQQIVRMEPDTFKGQQVRNGPDSVIGEIQMVVLDKENTQFHVVFSSDEFLDLGGDDLVVAIEDLEFQDGILLLRSQDAVKAYLQQDYLVVQEAA
ncbi:MAG: PRC-barrel domain-containing protein [Pseudohongiellaceae bacterium]